VRSDYKAGVRVVIRPEWPRPLQDPPPPLFFGCGRLPELGLSLRNYFIHSVRPEGGLSEAGFEGGVRAV
jgi:hypothetical protein